jgi:GT2 family glycosyltransferase
MNAVLRPEDFIGPEGHADVAVLVVTHNNATDIDLLVNSLRRQLDDQTIRMIVADNNSTDDTIGRLKRHRDVTVLPIRSNLGYAGGINVARTMTGNADTILVLNPDLELAPNSLLALRERLRQDNVGAAVPRLLDSAGHVYPSLRREPNLLRALGDAVLGERLGGRPGALSEIELKKRRYGYPHSVDWATGAALLIESEIAQRVGEWDEQFFLYSEETDYLRRVRELGCEIWFEPQATMHHRGAGSGTSDRLRALMAVNKIRYQEKWHGRGTAAFYRGVVILGSLLRSFQSHHRAVLRFLVSRRRWSTLPPNGQPIRAEETP